MQLQINLLINRTETTILFILGVFTFCIAFGLSSPALLVNDEWITVNQVNQLATGSQLIESEGKYGRTFEGDESVYFTSRGSYLAYTIFLPILSLPAMFGITATGDLFRLILLVIWFVLGMCALFACIWLLDKSDKKNGVFIIWLLIILFFGIFLANLYYYQPFASSFIDSPIESAAVILTNEVLLSFMTPMIYLIFRNLSIPRKTSIIGAISVICCSSYLIWSSSAKDHLLVAFLLTVIFLVFSSVLVKNSPIKWFLLFLISGLLCWARTEYGAIVLTGLLIWVLISDLVIQKDIIDGYLDVLRYQIFPGLLGLIIGLMPFLINNCIVTGNPFIPPQYLYVTKGKGALISVPGTNGEISFNMLSKFNSYVHEAINFFSPNIDNLLTDILGLLFAPENQGVGILFICPIILPALLYAIIHYLAGKREYSNKIRIMLLFSGFIVILTLLGYLRVLHGSTISVGSIPDMRYFSPIYLPLGIISILLLSPVINRNAERWLNSLLVILFLGVPLLVIFTVFYLSYGISFEAYVNLYMRILLVILLLLFGITACYKKMWKSQWIFPMLFSLLVMVPSVFQFFFVVVNALSKMNGYLYWQPILQYLFTYVIIVMG